MSLTNLPDKSADWLAHAYSLGWTDIATIRVTPDLANLRRARSQRFADLTTVTLRAELQPAVRQHDVLFYNDSQFDLTNVKVTLRVSVNQEPLSPVNIRIARIPAKNRWLQEDAVLFFGNSYDSMNMARECDQCADTRPPQPQPAVTTVEVPRPSFNCANAATPSEKLICSDTGLAAQEREMAADYSKVLQHLIGAELDAFRAEHSQWFRQYARTCNAPMSQEDRKACIRGFLAQRIKQLQTALQ
jgi:hypothetical protein